MGLSTKRSFGIADLTSTCNLPNVLATKMPSSASCKLFVNQKSSGVSDCSRVESIDVKKKQNQSTAGSRMSRVVEISKRLDESEQNYRFKICTD